MEIAQAFVGIRADTKNLKPDISRGVDSADLEGEGKKAGSRFGAGMGAVVGIAAAAGLVSFGRSSIAAFKEAEVAQTSLSNAFAKFPALADINRSALDKLNTSLAQKTRFDDDALASGQANLAMFGLTGTQIAELTPLLADYAAKTGTDLPTAAEQLGKATQGQGRALKAVGIDFQDTGTFAGNLDQVMGGLRANVGGFAEVEGKTAAGQSEILKNRFGELQETVGQHLIPILTQLAAAGIATLAWMEDNNELVLTAVSVLGAFAVILGVVKVAQLAAAAASAIASGATAAWTAAQWLLNVALTANPIGIVIALIAALVAGIIIAYKNSETFRDIVDNTWQVIQDAASFAWNNVLKPIFAFYVEAARAAWQGMEEFARIVGIVWETIKTVFQAGVRFAVETFLNLVGIIIRGAADAFGWVPGIGPKLREAADRFEDFKNSVNTSLANVQDQDVSVTARLKKEGIDVSSFLGSTAGRLATGGPVRGPGSATSDSIPAWLSNGEWVINADAAKKLGASTMQAINQGMIPGFARGGPAQFNVRADTGQAIADTIQASREMSADIDASSAKMLTELARSFTAPAGGQGANGLTASTAAARAMIVALFGITNIGGYSYRNIAGTNTLSDHALGKALDIMTSNVTLGNSIVTFLHSLPSLKYTIWRQYYYPKGGEPRKMADRGSVTQNHFDHVHASFFDQGGWLPPGLSLAYNGTGRPERVVGPNDASRAAVVVNVYGSVMTERDLARTIRDRLAEMGRRGDPLPAGV